VIKGIENYRHYLLGKEFILKIDHKALVYLMNAKKPTSRLLRWTLKLKNILLDCNYSKLKIIARNWPSRMGIEKSVK
jgi:hypothetical protein